MCPWLQRVSECLISVVLAHWPVPPQSLKHRKNAVYIHTHIYTHTHFHTHTHMHTLTHTYTHTHTHTHKPISVHTNYSPVPIHQHPPRPSPSSSPHAAHLYDLALLITDPHDDLHVLLSGLVVLVEVAALQGEVDVVADVSRHDDLREAQLAGHHGAAVHQVGVLLPDLNYVPDQSLHGDPQTWTGGKLEKEGSLLIRWGPTVAWNPNKLHQIHTLTEISKVNVSGSDFFISRSQKTVKKILSWCRSTPKLNLHLSFILRRFKN